MGRPQSTFRESFPAKVVPIHIRSTYVYTCMAMVNQRCVESCHCAGYVTEASLSADVSSLSCLCIHATGKFLVNISLSHTHSVSTDAKDTSGSY